MHLRPLFYRQSACTVFVFGQLLALALSRIVGKESEIKEGKPISLSPVFVFVRSVASSAYQSIFGRCLVRVSPVLPIEF
jgi:hypothetical protein